MPTQQFSYDCHWVEINKYLSIYLSIYVHKVTIIQAQLSLLVNKILYFKFEGSVFSIAKQFIHPCVVLTPRCAKRLAKAFIHNY